MAVFEFELDGEVIVVPIRTNGTAIDLQFGANQRYRRVIGAGRNLDLSKRRESGFGQRGRIKGRSYMSVRRLIEAIAKHSGFLDRPLMFVTMTYGRDYADWSRAKRDFKVWRDAMRREFGTMTGFWVAEAQKRGAPHFHLLVDLMSEKAIVEMKLKWLEVSGSGGSSDLSRARYGFHVRECEATDDRAVGAMYLAKVVTFESIKRSQQAYDQFTGRTWGYINKPNLEQYAQPLDENNVTEDWLADWVKGRFEIAAKEGNLNVKVIEDIDTGEPVAIWHPRMWSIDDEKSSNDNR